MMHLDPEMLERARREFKDSSLLPQGIEARAALSTQLHGMFELYDQYMPQSETVNILSLGCGFPDEFLALKYFYETKGIKINYVGVDIDENQMTGNSQIFSKCDKRPVLVTGDIKEPFKLEALIQAQGQLPESGFDFIILRQPNVLKQADVVFTALKDTIPYFASESSKVFISTYHILELNAVQAMLKGSTLYREPGRNNCQQKSARVRLQLLDTKDDVYPDNYNVILTCNGLALKNKLGYGRIAKIVRSQFFKTPLEIPLNRELKLHIETVKDAIIKQIPSLRIG